MTMQNNLDLIVKNLVILSLIDKKIEKKELILLQNLLNKPEWFFEFSFTEQSLKEMIKKSILELQVHDTQEMAKEFNQDIFKSYKTLMSEFIAEFSLTNEELSLLNIPHSDLSNPMSALNISRFEEYIEALIIYACVDEKEFKLPQSEAKLILNEINIYVKGNYALAKKEYFRIQKKATRNTKRYMSVRFNGVMVENFLKLTDDQDKHLLMSISTLSRLNDNKSLQERSFDGIVKQAYQRAKLLQE